MIRFFLKAIPVLAVCAALTAAPARADNADTAKQITSELLTAARTHLTSEYNRFKALTDRAKVDEASDKIQQKVQAAEVATQAALVELNKQLDLMFSLNTQALLLPELVDFHADLSNYARRYRQQVGLTVTNPIPGVSPLPGLFYTLRDAMGYIADSLGDQLESHKEVIVFYRDLLAEMSAELTSLALADGASDGLLAYGADHYVSLRSARLREGAATLKKVPALLDGVDAAGLTLGLKLPCTNDSIALINFNSQLTAFRPTVNTLDDWNDFRTGPLEGLINFYNGFLNTPGVLSHYASCRATLADRMSLLLQSKIIAESEGNKVLAADFDRQINDLISEDDRVLNEFSVIEYRRDQLSDRINGSGSAQSADNPSSVWKATVQAHIDNLIAASLITRNLFNSASQLIGKAQSEMDLLKGVAEGDRRGRMSQTAAKLRSIKENGFDKMLVDLDFAISSTRIFSSAVRRGDFSLLLVMGTYESAIEQQAAARNEDAANLPPEIAATEQEITKKRTVYDETVVLRQSAESQAAVFEALKTSLFSKEAVFEQVVGAIQLNPIYTTLATKLFSSVTSNAEYKKEKSAVDEAVRDLLSQFEGILEKPAAAAALTEAQIRKQCKQKFKKVKGPAKKKKINKCVVSGLKKNGIKGGWTKTLAAQKDKMAAQIAAEFNEASRVHLGGQSAGEILSQMSSDREKLLAIQ